MLAWGLGGMLSGAWKWHFADRAIISGGRSVGRMGSSLIPAGTGKMPVLPVRSHLRIWAEGRTGTHILTRLSEHRPPNRDLPLHWRGDGQ